MPGGELHRGLGGREVFSSLVGGSGEAGTAVKATCLLPLS